MRRFIRISALPADSSLSVIQTIRQSRISFSFEGRNAWWGEWSDRYLSDSFFLDAAESRGSVEPHRVQGSTWRTVEWPLFEFVSGDFRVAIVEMYDPDSVGPHLKHRLRPPTIGRLLQISKDRLHRWSVFLLAGGDSLDYSRRHLRSWKSFPRGPGRYLGWEPGPSKPAKTRYLTKIQEAWDHSLDKSAFLGFIPLRTETGIKIRKFHPESPLLDSGLSEGDIILRREWEGMSRFFSDDLSFRDIPVGSRVTLTIGDTAGTRRVTFNAPAARVYLEKGP